MSGRLIIYVLGPTSSGKTSLVQQLVSMSEAGALLTQCTHQVPTKGQELRTIIVESPKGKDTSRTVELRELGGDMAPMWEKFIEARLNSTGREMNNRFGLMLVVDSLAPHLLPLAQVTIAKLKGSEGLCRDWPVAVLLNKAAGRNAVTTKEAMFFLSAIPIEGIKYLAIDSWNGLGLMDVMTWLRSFAFPP
ncbi:Miro-like protein, putative [Trypanosoma equiperdum]|uniref:Miro-like protein n=3 Tax=Trypanozoon TaxID=39700 RepID=Q57X79_TRYB2|nr:hypothetical protein, conserved [Trypanosoma brucei brucei TREU927]AAX69790.1 hypothetical protein, conserved [Trypanosoma brucei]AAZ12527.1 hypothetical protein, conserved [Trypanosoma brucei brucei TREU927]RHW71732.1 Miro-like protein [Trypanosoma brucei equiperdum]SCU72343.1 Miro-like protein, putative [Trypanosoma equiperdum]